MYLSEFVVTNGLQHISSFAILTGDKNTCVRFMFKIETAAYSIVPLVVATIAVVAFVTFNIKTFNRVNS